MKTLLFALALLSPAAHAENLHLLCKTETPTTAFELSQDADGFLVKMKHFNGTDFMPIHEGVIVPADLPNLARKAKLLTKLGTYTEFRFPKDRCHVYGKGLVGCGDGETKEFDGVKMQGLNFYTTKVHESTLGLELDSWKATLSIWSPDFSPVMDISMTYGPDDCRSTGF